MKNLRVRHKLDIILVLVVCMIAGSAFCAIQGMNTIGKGAEEAIEEEMRTQYDNQDQGAGRECDFDA